MNREDELIRKAIRKGMPDQESVLNHCILALEKEEKENASMKAKKFVPRKLIVVACVAISIMAASTICYAATGEFPIKLIINGQERDANAYLDGNTLHIENEENDTTQDIILEPGTNAEIDVETDMETDETTSEVTIDFYGDEPGSVSVEENSAIEK